MIQEIRRRYSWLPSFKVEIGAEFEHADENVKLRAAIEVMCRKAAKEGTRADLTGAVLTRTVLTRADLTRADLTRADLTRADLTGAVMTDADLTRADLTGAVMTDADLTRADLTGAILTRADLTRAVMTDADLTRADLTALEPIRTDLFDVLLRARDEVPYLLTALREGRVNGSTYEGECACLVGTIANARKVSIGSLGNLIPNSSRPAERWFLAIEKGCTPANHPITAITERWVLEFMQIAGVKEVALGNL